MSRTSKNRSRGFCFTISNYTDDDIARCMALYEDDPLVSYIIIGFEKCPRTGTPHIQGYIYYPNKITWRVMKDKLSPYHVEPQKAKFNVNAYCYCMEDRDYYEMGNRPRQGHRTDLEVIKHDILDGKSEKKIATEYFSQWCQYRRAFTEYRKLIDESIDRTLVYGYDLTDYESIKKVYDMVGPSDLIVKEPYENGMSVYMLSHEVFAKKYRNIFVPKGEWLSNLPFKLNDI